MGTKERVDVLRPKSASFGSILGLVSVVTSTNVLGSSEGKHAAKKQK